MTDAGANALLRVRAERPHLSGRRVSISGLDSAPAVVRTFSAFAATTDAVPTSVVLGPDGAYYVSELTGVPFVDTRANVYRVVPADEPQMFFIQDACLTGFKMILDMAFDDEGNLYVLQHRHRRRSGDRPGSSDPRHP